MYMQVKELPETVQSALRRVHYHRKDISIEARETVSMAISGGDGSRGFVLLVNIDNGTIEEHWGSWGGANMFNPRNAVDLDTASRAMPEGAVVIHGSISGNPTYATITVHPDRLVKMLPASTELTNDEKMVLRAYKGLKSGPYRQEALQGVKALQGILDGLVSKGMLKRNKAGACQITTNGKNAVPGW